MVRRSFALGITTINSANYIYSSLERYLKECLLFESVRYDFEIVVCLNGVIGNEFISAKKEILRFISSYSKYKITLLLNDVPGKNLALNKLLDYVRLKEIEILHVLDDDLEIASGSIFRNIDILIKKNQSENAAFLSGSHFAAKELSLKKLISRQRSIYRGFIAWLLQKIFILPYCPIISPPKFCSGQSFASFVDNIPSFPKDGIADDAFLNNYFIHVNKKNIECNGMTPILKPEGSCVYFYVPCSLKEWTGSKLRNYVGITRASMFFKDDFDYLESYFAWPFSFLSAYRTNPKLRGRDAIKYSIYEILLRQLEKKGQTFIASGENPDWATARSTK